VCRAGGASTRIAVPCGPLGPALVGQWESSGGTVLWLIRLSYGSRRRAANAQTRR